MSGHEQKSPKLRSGFKSSQSATMKRREMASKSAQPIRVTQGTMGIAAGSEHDNDNEFLNNTGSERPQTPTAAEMPTTSFAEQNASAPTAESEAGTVRNANISPMLSSNTAATAGSDAAAIPDSDATVTVASEAATGVDENAEAPTAQSSTMYPYTFPGSASGNGSTANIRGIQNDAKTEETKTEEKTVDDFIYECNICLDTPTDAVVTLCGHLFCWLCLNQWLETRPNRKLRVCPVCKGAIGKDNVIPIYGRESTEQKDPRNKVPPRPAGQRAERNPQQGFGFDGAFVLSFSMGAFPFGAPSFNLRDPRAVAANRGPTIEQQLSKFFLYLAFLCIAWLLWLFCFAQ